VGGLWHGAGWTFVLWGGLHGVYLVVNHGWRALGVPLPRFVSAALTFVAVLVAWVFFRADDLPGAMARLHVMALGDGLSLPRAWEHVWLLRDLAGLRFDGTFHNSLFPPARALATLGFGLAVVWLFPSTQDFFRRLEPALQPGLKERRWPLWRPTWQWGCI